MKVRTLIVFSISVIVSITLMVASPNIVSAIEQDELFKLAVNELKNQSQLTVYNYSEVEKQMNERWGKQQNKQSCIDMNFSVPCTEEDNRLIELSQQAEKERQIQALQPIPNKVNVWVYIDTLSPLGDSYFNGTATVCIETKGGQYGDATQCDPVGWGIGSGSSSQVIPFVISELPTAEGVHLPEGKEFFACAQITTHQNLNIRNCVPAVNDGRNLIEVHVPFSIQR